MKNEEAHLVKIARNCSLDFIRKICDIAQRDKIDDAKANSLIVTISSMMIAKILCLSCENEEEILDRAQNIQKNIAAMARGMQDYLQQTEHQKGN